MGFDREPIPPSQRIRILTRDGFRCAYCGATKETARMEVDHVIPVSAGGKNDDGNLVAACWACNRGKRDSLLVDVMESDVGVYVKSPTAVAATAKKLVTVPEAAWDASRKCDCLMAAWRPILQQWWREVEVLPESVEINSVGESFTFSPSFICRGRAGCDIGPEVRVLVVGWREVGRFTCEEQLQIRNAAISGYDVPTMILMGPPDFFYGVLVNDRYKGTAKGRVIDGFLQPVEEWWCDGWYPDECLVFEDLREPFFSDLDQFALRDFDGDTFHGVYSSAYRKGGFADGI